VGRVSNARAVIELAGLKLGGGLSTTRDVKLSVARGLWSEGVVMTGWLLDFAFVESPLEDRAKRREIDTVGLEPLMEYYWVRPHALHSPPHDHYRTRHMTGKECEDRPSKSSLCLAGMLVAEAAASTLVPEPGDTGIAEIAGRGGGIVVVAHVIVVLAASSGTQIGEGMDVHVSRNWTLDGLCYHLRDCSYAFLDHSLVLGWQAAEVAFVQQLGAALEVQKSPTFSLHPQDTRIVHSTSRDCLQRPF
jgi:hypothetical protein